MAGEKEINDVILFGSAARTVAPASLNEQDNRYATGLVFTIDCTVIGSAPSVVFTLEGYDAASAKWYSILASAAITAVGTTTYYVFPAATVTANVSANKRLPRRWRIKPVHGNTDTITYSVGATMLFD